MGHIYVYLISEIVMAHNSVDHVMSVTPIAGIPTTMATANSKANCDVLIKSCKSGHGRSVNL